MNLTVSLLGEVFYWREDARKEEEEGGRIALRRATVRCAVLRCASLCLSVCVCVSLSSLLSCAVPCGARATVCLVYHCLFVSPSLSAEVSMSAVRSF